MQTLVDFFHRLSDLPGLVQWAGLFGLAAIIFSETGLLAGVAGMKFTAFISYNIFGAFFWICSMVGIGYFLGNYIPGIDQHIEIVVVIVVFISLLPGIISGVRARRKRRYAASAVIER